MKTLLLAMACLMLTANLSAQAYETKVKYNKVEQPGASVDIAVNVDIVEETLKADLKGRGLGKGDSEKGFIVYKGVIVPEISADKIDLYVKADKKSKKDKANSTITAMVSKGYDNFVNGTTEPTVMAGLIKYLNSLTPKFAASNTAVQIEDQAKLVEKAEKKLTNLNDDVSDMEKKIKKLQKDIEDKKAEIEKQKTEIQKEKAALEALKAKL